jgi:uncharacterized protein YneF (UPF0154 family)
MLCVGLLSSPPIAFMSFDFMFPNITAFSLSKNLMIIMVVSILIGMPGGYFIKRTNLAMVSVILYTTIGYAEGVVLYSTPYTVYNLENLLPGFYYAMFFRFTVILLFFFILGGFIGAVFGQFVKDITLREQTKTDFTEKPDS